MEVVIVLHETIHEMYRKKHNGIIFKIDFEKAYEKINWTFVQQTLRIKDFSPTWRRWVGHVGINDIVRQNFETKKGVRQGDPLSPILSNIVVDMLVILINSAKGEGQLSRVITHLLDDGLSILQYADDMILFMEHNFDLAKNLKLVLSAFEQLSSLKINFHKSEIFYFREAKDYESQYEQLFGCKKGAFLFRYLGIPMHHRKLNNKD
jgi:retron-type reverse transcriptase